VSFNCREKQREEYRKNDIGRRENEKMERVGTWAIDVEI